MVCHPPHQQLMVIRMEFLTRMCYNIRVLFDEQTRRILMWTKPQATEMRFGFEVTMYVLNK